MAMLCRVAVARPSSLCASHRLSLSPLQPLCRTLSSSSLQPVSRTLSSLQPVSRTLSSLQPVSRTLSSLQPVSRTLSSLQPIHRTLSSLQPLSRTLSSASFTCDRNKTHRSHIRLHAAAITPLPGFCPRHAPHRLASTGPGEGAGWYESVSNSTAVHLTEQLLVSAHEATGLPWWASIACTTLALRTVVTLPLGVYQMVIIAKVEALQAEIAALAKRLSFEVSVRAKETGWTERDCRYQFKKNMRRIVSELYVRDNCHPLKGSVLVWVQLPMWVCLSLALRNLSLGVSESAAALQCELAAGGALWFSDLTLPDSTWIMPVCLGLVNLLIVEIFALRRLEVSRFQKNVTNLIRVLSVLMIPIASTVPSSLALYWLSSSCVGLVHNLLLRSVRLRRLCGVPASRSDSDTPYRDIANAFLAKYLK